MQKKQAFEMKPLKNGIWLTVNGLGSPTPFLLISFKSMQKKQAFEMKPPKERHQADREAAGVADPKKLGKK
jgi:hypothetical protein